MEDWRNGGFGLYVHWPFCAAKCPYCDFNSHVSAAIDQEKWRDAYVSEIRRFAKLTEGRVLQSVYFGGGTPSLMDPALIESILSEVRANWPLSNDIEITLEANPTSVESGRFAGYRKAGVNRVSMGIQALNNADLKALGRLHSVEEALAALDVARSVFDRVSFDLIYARQNQTLPDWKDELRKAIECAGDHLSLYQLTIESGTAFGDRYKAGKLRGLPDDDLSADMFELTQEICNEAGFPAYEVSNHAKPGHESRHNMIYWRYGDYVGIGPGAHGRLTINGQRFATETVLSPNKWLDMVSTTAIGTHRPEPLSLDDQAAELLLMGLRTVEGISIARLTALEGDKYLSNINDLIDLGLVQCDDGVMRATAKGRPVLNAVLREILAD